MPVLKRIEGEKDGIIWKKDDLWNREVCNNITLLSVLHRRERGNPEITILKSKFLKLIQEEPFWSDDESELKVKEYIFDEQYCGKFDLTNCFVKAFLSEGRVVSFLPNL